MTYKQVANMVRSMGLPFAYRQFTEQTAVAPPFICYFYSNTDDLMADDENYVGIPQLNIELYTAEKDFDEEAVVEEILKENGFTYYKEEAYIDSEKMYQIAYEMEVVINEQG